jgi:hypothetical protein
VRTPERLLPESVANLRDLGGLPTAPGLVLRSRRLLRSGALGHSAPGTLDEITELLGPATYIDLRTDREVDRDGGAAALVERGWSWCRLPLRDDDLPYNAAVPRYAATAVAVAERLGDGPVVVACSLGKDRTGMVVALLLHWLGVPTHLVAEDFAASTGYLTSGRHLLPGRWRDSRSEIRPATDADCVAALVLAPPRPALVAALEAVMVTPAQARAGH